MRSFKQGIGRFKTGVVAELTFIFESDTSRSSRLYYKITREIKNFHTDRSIFFYDKPNYYENPRNAMLLGLAFQKNDSANCRRKIKFGLIQFENRVLTTQLAK